MTLLNTAIEIVALFCSWRAYLSVIPAMLLAWLLLDQWPEARWLGFLTVPSAAGALVVGRRWNGPWR